nr:hypothetical protein I308_01002 [Cryptococcus tetragattii IND107]
MGMKAGMERTTTQTQNEARVYLNLSQATSRRGLHVGPLIIRAKVGEVGKMR